jgi:cytoskeleton protein RodZ
MHLLARMGVGTQLRRARESRGVTVRDLADSTKIPTRQIDAIESERYEKLPGGIFGRGYVRAVAEALRLDADAIVGAYRDETEPERSAMPVIPAASGVDEPPRRAQAPQQVSMAWRMERSEPRIRMAPGDLVKGRSLSTWVAAVLIGVAAILVILWFGRDRSPAPLSGRAPEAAPAARGGGRDNRATPSPLAAGAQAPPRADATTRAATPAGSELPVGTVGEAGASQAASRAADDGVVDLLIVAERSSWIVLNVDGARIARRRLQPREAVHVQMRTRATVHTGDAGALKMSMNGGAFAPLGPPGAVRTIEITPPAR